MAGLHTLRASDERNFESASFGLWLGAQHPPMADAPAWQDLQSLSGALRFPSDSTRTGSALARFFGSLFRKDLA